MKEAITTANLDTFTEHFIYENLEYYILSYADHQVKLTGIADDYDPKTIAIPAEVEYQGVRYTVVSMGYGLPPGNDCNFDFKAPAQTKVNVSEIRIPETIFNIGDDIHYDFTEVLIHLKKIVIDKRNPYFISIDNVIYTKDLTTLIWSAPLKRTIHIPDTVSRFFSSAFRNSHIRDFRLPDSLIYIRSMMFERCNIRLFSIGSKLQSIINNNLSDIFIQKFELSPANTSFILEDGILYTTGRILIRCQADRSGHVILHNCAIQRDAFIGCHFDSLSIADMRNTAFFEVFIGCRIDTFILASGYMNIDSSTFQNCRIGRFIVEDVNSPYYTRDGVLYNKDDELVLFPTLRKGTFVVEDNVEGIKESAFEGCQLSKIIIHSQITVIEESTFCESRYLKEVVLPSSIREIKNLAFGYCLQLKKINLPFRLYRIYQGAFSYCLSLKNIQIPQGTILDDGGGLDDDLDEE